MSRAYTAPLLLLVVYFETLQPAHAQADSSIFGGGVGVASDYVFRGVSQTLGQRAVEGYLEFNLDSGLYGYAWGSNVDFVPSVEPTDGVDHEVDLSIGYVAELSDRWSLDVAMVRYLFPGAVDGVDYDYSELIATAWLNDTHSVTVAYSASVDGTGEKGIFYKLGTGIELPAGLALDVDLGHYDLDAAYGASYSFLQTTLRKSVDNWSMQVSFVNTFGPADDIYYQQSTGTRLFLSLLYEL